MFGKKITKEMNRILGKSNDNTNENQLKKGGDILNSELISKFVLD